MPWRVSRSYLLFREGLIGLLAAAIAVTSVPSFGESAAPAATPQPPARIDPDTSNLEFVDAQLAALLVQARNFGSPGLPPSPPTAYQLAQIEADFLKVRPELEKAFFELAQGTSETDLTYGVSFLAFTADLYFKLALRMEILSVISKRAIDPNRWAEKYSLRLPLESLADFAFAKALSQINEGFTNQEAIFNGYLDIPQRQLVLSLSLRGVRVVEEARLAANPSLSSVENMAQYFAADALVTNWLELSWRQEKRPNLQIPGVLLTKYPALGYRQMAHEESLRLLYNKQLADLAEAQLPEIFTELAQRKQTFVTPELVRKIIAITGSTEELDDEKYDLLTQALAKLESSNGVLASISLVGLINMPNIVPYIYTQHLSWAIAQAKAMVIRNEFLNSQNNPLSEEQASQLRALIQLEAENFADKLLVPLNPHAGRIVKLLEQANVDAHKRVDESFLKSAYEYIQLGQNEDVAVDPSALALALGSKINQAELSPQASQQFARVMMSENYTKARTEYTRLLMDHLYLFPGREDQDIATEPDGTLKAEALRDWIMTTQFQDSVWQAATESHPGVKTLTKSVARDAVKDALGWIKAGEAVGFYKFSSTEPKVKDFKLSGAQRKAYFDVLKLRLAEEFPLFALKIAGPLGRDTVIHQLYPPLSNNQNNFEYEFGGGSHATAPEPRDPQEVLSATWAATEELIKRNLRVVAGEERSLYEQTKIKIGLGKPKELTDEFLTVLSQSLPIARQVGTHPELGRLYARMLSNISEVTWVRRAWDPLVKFNGQVMWAMVIFYLADALLKFPASKAGNFISWLRASSLVPSFGTGLNRLNNVVLGIFGISLIDTGVEAFLSGPQIRDRIEKFTTCSLNGPCVVNMKSLKAWEEEVSALQSAWLFQLGTMAAFIFAFFGLSYLRAWRELLRSLDALNKNLEAKMRDIGFQNGRYSFQKQDLHEMAESTIATLGPRTHPAFNPNKPLPENLKGLEGRPGNVRPSTTHQAAGIAKAGIASRIRSTVVEIEEMVRDQQIYWENWRSRLRSHLLLFNKDARFPSPEEFQAFGKQIELRLSRKEITPEVAAYLKEARREVATFLAPHYIRAETDPLYGSLLQAILGLNRAPKMFADDLAALKQFGAGYYTIARRGAMVARDKQIVPIGQTPREGIPYRTEIQRARRTHVYRIENEKWLKYLRRFIDAKDVFPNSGPNLLKGPQSGRLIEGPELRALLQDLRGRQ